MDELLEKNQVISVVPKDFRNSNKGKVIDITDRDFSLELFHAPIGILPHTLIEFYSPTKNGMLYFSTSVLSVEKNFIKIKAPIKHRFLQRRAFTRIKLSQDSSFECEGKSYKVELLDLSAGGLKLKSSEYLNINNDYDVNVKLMMNKVVKGTFEPIRIEKNEDGTFTLSGRFKNMSNPDKMLITQFCMRKSIENLNK